MKNLITLIGCVLILLAMFIQIAQNQVTYNKLACIDSGIQTFKDKTSHDGCISKENEEWLKEYIARETNCEKDDISVSGNYNAVSKGQLIHYDVKVKVSNLLSSKAFWGFTKDEDQRVYHINRYVVSQKEEST